MFWLPPTMMRYGYSDINDEESSLAHRKSSNVTKKVGLGCAVAALCGTSYLIGSNTVPTVDPMFATATAARTVPVNPASLAKFRNLKVPNAAAMQPVRVPVSNYGQGVYTDDAQLFVGTPDFADNSAEDSNNLFLGAICGATATALAGYAYSKKKRQPAETIPLLSIATDGTPYLMKGGGAMLSIAGQQARPYDQAPGGPEELIATASSIASTSRGILASDESNGTCGLRLQGIGVENTEDNRRAYRGLLFTTKNIGDHCSGAILYEETLFQSSEDGTPFVDILKEQGVIPGIKVDTGIRPIPGTNGEVCCSGIDGLPERAKKYYDRGARFAKWRAVLNITKDGNPSELAIQDTAWNLGRYAAICQSEGLVPIVEPEILMDGDHTIDEAQAVHEKVWGAVYKALHDNGVLMEGSILKPSMVVPGVDGPKVSSEEIAKRTVDSLMRRVPPNVAGITFLSGGQSEEEATKQLNDMNVYAAGKNPWSLTFSYGRALQASVLKVWGGKPENVESAQGMLYGLLKANGQAQEGKYDDDSEHPSTTGSLYVADYKY